MKFTEHFFKVPVKTYTARDWKQIRKKEEQEFINEEELEEPPYAEGYAYFYPDDISSIDPSFSYPRSIHDVSERGFDLTIITLKNGNTISVNWDPERFIEELDNHIDKVRKAHEEEIEREKAEEQERQIAFIREMLETKLADVVAKYEQQGLKLKAVDIEELGGLAE